MYYNVFSVSITLKFNLYHLNPENATTLQVCSSYQMRHIAHCCCIGEYFEERQ